MSENTFYFVNEAWQSGTLTFNGDNICIHANRHYLRWCKGKNKGTIKIMFKRFYIGRSLRPTAMLNTRGWRNYKRQLQERTDEVSEVLPGS